MSIACEIFGKLQKLSTQLFTGFSQFKPLSPRRRYIFPSSQVSSIFLTLQSDWGNLSHRLWHEQFVCFLCLVSWGQISTLIDNKIIFNAEGQNKQRPCVKHIMWPCDICWLITEISPRLTTDTKFVEDSNLESWGKKTSLFHLLACHHMLYRFKNLC